MQRDAPMTRALPVLILILMLAVTTATPAAAHSAPAAADLARYFGPIVTLWSALADVATTAADRLKEVQLREKIGGLIDPIGAAIAPQDFESRQAIAASPSADRGRP